MTLVATLILTRIGSLVSPGMAIAQVKPYSVDLARSLPVDTGASMNHDGLRV